MRHLTPYLRLAAALAAAVLVAALSSCHGYQRNSQWAYYMAPDTADSAGAVHRPHYAQNYNFVVKADSMPIVSQQPEEVLNHMHTDTLTLYRRDHIAVADIRIIPTDSIDSIWVQVARDQLTFGWLHEKSLLAGTVPDDPISQFISTFSDTHLLIFLIFITAIATAYLMRTIFRRNARIVHFNDIPTLYPTLLALTVAAGAVMYASIQLFAGDVWEHFYYHPTLNPFIVPPVLGVFLVSVWAMLIIAIATADVVRGMLPASEALLYLCGLAGVCAVNYIVFSVATLYYIGYPLFIAYAAFALRAYLRRYGRLYRKSQ